MERIDFSPKCPSCVAGVCRRHGSQRAADELNERNTGGVTYGAPREQDKLDDDNEFYGVEDMYRKQHEFALDGFYSELFVGHCSCGWRASRRSRAGLDEAFNTHIRNP